MKVGVGKTGVDSGAEKREDEHHSFRASDTLLIRIVHFHLISIW